MTEEKNKGQNSSEGQLPGNGKRVLIVDDSEITAEVIASQLEAKGFEILIAVKAETATQLVLKKNSRPDLILLDLNMPNIDGAQFCRFIKSNAMFSDIKVVFCYSLDENSLKTLVEECGAEGYLTKDRFLDKTFLDELN